MIERAGADFIGINLVAGPRRVERATAADIMLAARGTATAVALMDARAATDPILRDLKRAGFRSVQLYGEVTADVVRRVRKAELSPWLVVHVGSPEDASRATEHIDVLGEDKPEMLVVDADAPGALGGTGTRADWNAIREEALRSNWPPIMLAGGLRAENVAGAIRAVTPFAVDVSSGVEKNPGRKSQARVEDFLRAARSA